MIDEAGKPKCDAGSGAGVCVFPANIEQIVIEMRFPGSFSVFWGKKQNLLAKKIAPLMDVFIREDAATFVCAC